jgi:insulysin
MKFHETYYSANLMKLVVLGREPLDQLEQWVVEKFAAVKNKDLKAPDFEGKPFTEKELQAITFPFSTLMLDRSESKTCQR